jgi:integrase
MLNIESVKSLRAATAERAPATRKYIIGTLARALDDAVSAGLLPFNVARMGKRQRRGKSARPATADKYAFIPDQVRLIAQGTRGDVYHMLWMLLLYTGMRSGEARALTWRNFDERARSLSIEATMDPHPSGGVLALSDPKTYSSRRTLAIPETVVAILRVHRASQAAQKLKVRQMQLDGTITDPYCDHGLIFASRRGWPISASNVAAGFHRMLRRVGLPAELVPHNCRHTAATNLLHAGVNPVEVSGILGHADPSITMKVYAHALPRGGRRAWVPPPGLTGLELLDAWYARAYDDVTGDDEHCERVSQVASYPASYPAAPLVPDFTASHPPAAAAPR